MLDVNICFTVQEDHILVSNAAGSSDIDFTVGYTIWRTQYYWHEQSKVRKDGIPIGAKFTMWTVRHICNSKSKQRQKATGMRSEPQMETAFFYFVTCLEGR